VSVKNINPLALHQFYKLPELPDGVEIVKAGQREFRYIREARLDLIVKRPALAKCGNAQRKTLAVEPLQKFNGLALGSSDVEAVDQVKHARTRRPLNRLRLIAFNLFSYSYAHSTVSTRDENIEPQMKADNRR
jgi:hypothetical protein